MSTSACTVSVSPCLPVSLSPCLPVSLSHCLSVCMCLRAFDLFNFSQAHKFLFSSRFSPNLKICVGCSQYFNDRFADSVYSRLVYFSCPSFSLFSFFEDADEVSRRKAGKRKEKTREKKATIENILFTGRPPCLFFKRAFRF